MNNIKTLGIMVANPILDPNRFQPYAEVASQEGFDRVIVFNPHSVHLRNKLVRGYVYNGTRWSRQSIPFPSITYDIGYYTTPAMTQMVRKIKETRDFPFITYGLGNKWRIQQTLMQDPVMERYLIPTQHLTDPSVLESMVTQHGSLMVKPINGKEGKGILRLRSDGEQLILEENDQPPISFTYGDWNTITDQLRTKGNFLLQKWVDIRNREGKIHDVRALMQKNAAGKWQITGMAVREGEEGRITSNLMDRGTPYPLDPYLKQQWGRRKARKIKRELERFAHYLCETVERLYGRRQAELGLDLAIDRKHRIWLIEVNIKPGKIPFQDVFHLTTPEARVRTPIQYARYVTDHELNQPEIAQPQPQLQS
ncbi:YheC/YheD family endospore coat-associated protein [Brevibacillus dissolubilis]|uniref:YheC/YheD family endospore coat-associated protein n=1 Tax=Brevibacillus dissolubilis TaxID=1844116 RepID=UPI00159BB615|nr:YheC/YheD family protein [Brevibacillus dissolubilis]